MPENLFTNQVVASERILYTASSFAKSSLLYLQEIGTLQAMKSHTSSRDNLNSYLVLMVQSGAGKLEYDGLSYQLQKGDCVFLDCNHPYSHTTSSENLWKLSWIHFNGEQLPSIYDKYVNRGGKTVIHPLEIKPFNYIHSSLFTVASTDDYIRDMKINSMLSQLLVYLMAESWDPKRQMAKKKKRDLLPIKMYLDEHAKEKILLNEISEQFYINKYYLIKSFKEQYGVSICNYLLNVRITKAKKMLRFTDKKVEIIGYECGLGALTYFSRTFKKVEGISPSQYRDKWNGQDDNTNIVKA